MEQATRHRLLSSLSCCYEEIGHDAWGEGTPSDDNFVDVLTDQIRNHISYRCQQCFATNEDVEEFFALSASEQRKIILEVGP